ncbi:hypothetical protein RclHR1_10850005 [Rhizophagus clarus]|uniref:Uncharacterized protein n=1 Tax=Rhizophagus clarus TaxID=94130 RepID=A0A2Z6QVL4_9GLOM|nr:hypothetical protein RclHR1_10850005 [Rhizophagus clarus]GES79429.1 hypothetical protein RCL_jg23166.t1 [Rhizophagus clarus]
MFVAANLVIASSSSNTFSKQKDLTKLLPNYYEQEMSNSHIDSLDQLNNRRQLESFRPNNDNTLDKEYLEFSFASSSVLLSPNCNESKRVYADDLFEAGLLNSWLKILTVDVMKRRLKMLFGHF